MMSPFSDRATSSHSVSIGTDLALESIRVGANPRYDDERILPDTVDMSKYDEIWINTFTLFRNLLGALPSQYNDYKHSPRDVADYLYQEMETIREVVKMVAGKDFKVVFYTCSYTGLERRFPRAKLLSDTTDKQRKYTDLLKASVSALYKEHPSDGMKHFSLELNPTERKRCLIMTHYAFDLLSHSSFKSLSLLESHTGVVKDRPLWYTKFKDGGGLVRIPFNKLFIQIFGDKVLFSPQPKKVRDEVLALAEKYNWTYATTDERVRLGLSMMKDVFASEILKEMSK